jgi:hypothetical protein
MKVWVKFHKSVQNNSKEIVAAICDEDILGKDFGGFKISEDFFKGKLVEIEDIQENLEKATIANLVGKNIVSWAVERGIVDASNVKEVERIPNAQIFSIH